MTAAGRTRAAVAGRRVTARAERRAVLRAERRAVLRAVLRAVRRVAEVRAAGWRALFFFDCDARFAFDLATAPKREMVTHNTHFAHVITLSIAPTDWSG